MPTRWTGVCNKLLNMAVCLTTTMHVHCFSTGISLVPRPSLTQPVLITRLGWNWDNEDIEAAYPGQAHFARKSLGAWLTLKYSPAHEEDPGYDWFSPFWTAVACCIDWEVDSLAVLAQAGLYSSYHCTCRRLHILCTCITCVDGQTPRGLHPHWARETKAVVSEKTAHWLPRKAQQTSWHMLLLLGGSFLRGELKLLPVTSVHGGLIQGPWLIVVCLSCCSSSSSFLISFCSPSSSPSPPSSPQLLGGFSLVDKMWNRSYVLSTQGEYTGGFAKWPDSEPGKAQLCSYFNKPMISRTYCKPITYIQFYRAWWRQHLPSLVPSPVLLRMA